MNSHISHVSPGSYFKTKRAYRTFEPLNLSLVTGNVSKIIGEGDLFMIVCCYPDTDLSSHHFVKSLDVITVKILYRSNLMDIAYWWIRDNCNKIA